MKNMYEVNDEKLKLHYEIILREVSADQWCYLMVMMLEAGISLSPISLKKLACSGFPWTSITLTLTAASLSTST